MVESRVFQAIGPSDYAAVKVTNVAGPTADAFNTKMNSFFEKIRGTLIPRVETFRRPGFAICEAARVSRGVGGGSW